MYVVELTYRLPLDAIEAHLEAHRRFLDKYYAEDIFLASGPKTPRDGGVILVRGHVDRAALEEILAEDPFQQHQVAAYRITEFTPVKFHPLLEGIR